MAEPARTTATRYRFPAPGLVAILAGTVVLMWLASMDPLLPSPQAAWLGPAVLALAAAGAAALGWAMYLRPPGAPLADWSDRAFAAMVLGGSFLVLHLSLRFCLPLLLHRLADPQPATQVEPVRVSESTSKRRGCGTAAVLAADSYLLRRRLCRVPLGLAQALRESGRIELRGRRSYFGIQVEDYAAAPPPPPPR